MSAPTFYLLIISMSNLHISFNGCCGYHLFQREFGLPHSPDHIYMYKFIAYKCKIVTSTEWSQFHA